MAAREERTTAVEVRAVVVEGPGSVPVVRTIDVEGVTEDEVLVRIAATGICHTDLAWAAGELYGSFPAVLGHEAAGVVEDVGPAVARFRAGDRVVVSVAHHCGHCDMCELGYPPMCRERWVTKPRYRLGRGPLVQAFGTGTFAEVVVLRERSLVAIPPDVPLPVAATTGCAVVTGFGAATRVAAVRPGSTVAVIGCGGVGISAILGSLVAGAERIVAVDPNESRRRDALAIGGATDAVDADEATIRELAPLGFDYVFECAGRVEA